VKNVVDRNDVWRVVSYAAQPPDSRFVEQRLRFIFA
jgi:hypothetical protein